ncbi:MAG: cation diffusion facilitator family transporter [Rhodopseudomonas sp.]|nr:cation diffusion facilitator family transporter [Rhodopseudomonas sp.]
MHGSHDHHHHYDHAHGLGHSHAPTSFGRTFAIATGLNVALVVAQVVYGLYTNSLALLADAGHNFGDVMGLVIAWLAFAIADWRPSSRFTYRMRAASILSAMANGLILLAATAIIVYEAVQRLMTPEPIATGPVIVVAAIAVVINGVSAWLLSRGSKGDLNMHGAFLHMLADAGVSVAVIVAAFGIMLTGWQWLDPAVSLLISVVILFGTWRLLRDSLRLALNAAPRDIDPAEVRRYFEALPQVAGLHDLHIWAMSTTENALTCHLVMPAGHPGDGFLQQVAGDLQTRFDICHTTVQIEVDEANHCVLKPHDACLGHG